MAKKILIIDDDKREDYNVTTVLSRRKALTLIQKSDFDLIISDIKMPGMDGIETVKKIREYLTQNNKKPIPEIFITAYAKEDIYQKALELNAVGYIEKPFDIKTLLQTTKEAIEKGIYYN